MSIAASVALAGGVAHAAWTASGSGSGGGAALTAKSLVVTAIRTERARRLDVPRRSRGLGVLHREQPQSVRRQHHRTYLGHADLQ